MTDVVLGSHTRTYEFKRVEEQSFFIAARGGGGERREKGERSGDFVCVSKKCRFILAKY